MQQRFHPFFPYMFFSSLSKPGACIIQDATRLHRRGIGAGVCYAPFFLPKTQWFFLVFFVCLFVCLFFHFQTCSLPSQLMLTQFTSLDSLVVIRHSFWQHKKLTFSKKLIDLCPSQTLFMIWRLSFDHNTNDLWPHSTLSILTFDDILQSKYLYYVEETLHS